MIYTVMDKMTFGKYKGSTIAKVLTIAGGKGYLRWAIEHVSFFMVDEHLRNLIGYRTKGNKPLTIASIPPPGVDEKVVDDIVKFIFS